MLTQRVMYNTLWETERDTQFNIVKYASIKFAAYLAYSEPVYIGPCPDIFNVNRNSLTNFPKKHPILLEYSPNDVLQ